jgi:hypothetical protein
MLKGSEKITSEKRAAWQKRDETIHRLSTIAQKGRRERDNHNIIQ